MKYLLVTLALFLPAISHAQSYEQQFKEASAFYWKKDYSQAFSAFKAAFQLDSNKANAYDYYTAARTAAKTAHIPETFSWLYAAQRRGLGLQSGELAIIRKDSAFVSIWADTRWNNYLQAMEQTLVKKQAEDKQKADAWASTINGNAVAMQNGHPNPGFARYHIKVDTLEVPYLVYVPTSMDTRKKHKLIVFLHGGVVSLEKFTDDNPDVGAQEPIFKVADSLGAIILYPFGRKDFGWSAQPEAFQNVLTITKIVEDKYEIDPSQMVMVGMSNGGTALFWYATQSASPYKGYLAISALPELKIGEIAFRQITPDKHFYSIHAKDDDVFTYQRVHDIYTAQKKIATGWHFDTMASGGHGLIYAPGGVQLMRKYLQKIFAE